LKFEGFPVVVGWELTLACNLRCGHCASTAGLPRPNELSPREALSLCNQFPALLVKEVDFTGGEPLLREDWPQIAERLNEFKISVHLVTNGLLLKDNVPLLRKMQVATVGVSIDGLEATHDRIRRRPGLFRTVVSGIEAAVADGVSIVPMTAISDLNINEMPELSRLFGRLGIKHWQIQPVFSLGRAKEERDLALSYSTFIKLGKFVADHNAGDPNNGLRIMPADGVGYYSALDTREREWQGCPAGKASCGITSDGKIKGCLSFPDHLIEGDLRKSDFWDVWFDEKAFHFNRNYSRTDLGTNCSGCEHGEECGGGCSVMSLASTQQFHNDPYCLHRLSKII
jgi:radical SAM protein with 4Fe4S-binding SPASM domain